MDFTKRIKLKSLIRTNTSNASTNEKKNSMDRGSLDQIKISSSEPMNQYLKEKEQRQADQVAPLNNPEVASDVLASIDKVYFTGKQDDNQEFDPEEFVLKKLPEELTIQYLLNEQQRFKRQLIVVSKKVSNLILKNQPAYTQELERVMHLQMDLSDAIEVCRQSRRCLDTAKTDFTCSSLKIVASYRRREVLRGLLKSLKKIKTLQETDIRLRELLEVNEDYSGAIQLYLECLEVVNSLKHYNCISELSNKLQDTLEMTEEQIDVALSKMCVSFNKTLYEKLQQAYQLLGKTQTAMDQLLMHFASAIHNKAFSIVLGYVELFSGNDNKKAENFHKRQFSELCKLLKPEGFYCCLKDLCLALWDIMTNYYKILNWHRDDEQTNNDDIESDQEVESSFNRRYVKQKLEHGLVRVWQDVQQKIRVLVQNHELSYHNFEEFIKILYITEKMVEVGEDFCGSKSEEFQDLIYKQTINYFENYHRSCMYELKMFLESETWTLCPLANNFTILDLQEFAFLKSPQKLVPIKSSPSNSPTRSISYFSREYLNNRETNPTPFDNFPVGDDFAKSECHNAQNYKTILDEVETDSSLIMTTATLNALRILGKYMHIMTILDRIAFDVLLCMFQTFDYYLFAIYKFFARDMLKLADNSVSVQMKATLKRISDELVKDENDIENHQENHLFNLYLTPTISSVVDMSNSDKLFGVSERIIAVESLVVLANHFQSLKKQLQLLIEAEKTPFLDQYFNQVISTTGDLRKPILMWVAVKSIPYEQIVAVMSQVRWDIREIPSMHSNYVDMLLKEIQTFNLRLVDVCKDQLNEISVPQKVINLLWENVLRLANRTFIEGFSQAKKCTNEGRALMQLDYQQFLVKVEAMTSLRPIPERELVEEYIKAYYLTEPALIQWIKSRKEYNPKQLTSLIACISGDNKKFRNRILSIFENESAAK